MFSRKEILKNASLHLITYRAWEEESNLTIGILQAFLRKRKMVQSNLFSKYSAMSFLFLFHRLLQKDVVQMVRLVIIM